MRRRDFRKMGESFLMYLVSALHEYKIVRRRWCVTCKKASALDYKRSFEEISDDARLVDVGEDERGDVILYFEQEAMDSA